MDDFLDTQKVQRGFTLAEMAIVVVLAGILLTMGMKMTVANLNNGAYAQTSGNMALVKIALISFLRTNGRMPCPDTNAVPVGKEVSPCNANVAAGTGVVPWITLGLPIGTVQDGWGNFIVYRVSNGVGVQVRNWTTNTVLANSFSMSQFTTPVVGLTINQTNGVANPTLITANAVAVLLSAGKNGYGAKTVQGQTNTIPPVANKDETTNFTAGSTTFVVRPVSDTAAGGRGTHNDMLIYMMPQDLLGPLVTEQTVLACKAYCPPPNTLPCTVPAGTTVPVGYPNPVCQ
jgi:prepilin-type N-terminal cleavage/methylation domain-containing protein